MKGNDQSWVHVLRDKYMRKDGSDFGWLAKPDSSPLWKTICRLHMKVPEGVSWIIAGLLNVILGFLSLLLIWFLRSNFNRLFVSLLVMLASGSGRSLIDSYL
ncbi:hypothetical protein NC652_002571 [Populus alba x Populus x berolinensis]|nr:hypothetical protein NC652_002571 [Populus alba x Populus x berolinensis]